MKAKTFTLEGKEKKEIELPRAFEEPYRPDLIKKAELAERSSKYQPKGKDPKSGLKNTARYTGKRGAYLAIRNTGRTHLPRLRNYPRKGRTGEVRKVPQAKGGRKAHPPKKEKNIEEKINNKERRKAIKSALAATAKANTIKERGHEIDDLEVPIIVEDNLEEVKKTKEVMKFLESIGLEEEIEKTRNSKKIRKGRGKSRGRKYKRSKSALIVPGEDKGIKRAARNIPGIDIVLAENLSADKLAPGGQPGRLTIYTESGIKKIQEISG